MSQVPSTKDLIDGLRLEARILDSEHEGAATGLLRDAADRLELLERTIARNLLRIRAACSDLQEPL